MADPWFKFYPTDWRADPALRMCSPAARGVWIDMICLMHEATPYGQLLVNGRCPTDAQIAVLLGTPPEQFSEYVGELESAGVFSRTKDGVIYSRKMTRWAKKSATARRNGRKGGNPRLCKEREKQASDNPQDKGKDKPQKPEARSQSIPSSNEDGAIVDFTKEVFDRGVSFLGKYGTPEPKARALIGKWRKEAGDAETYSAFSAASREGVTEPVAWITARLRPNTQPTASEIMKDINLEGLQ